MCMSKATFRRMLPLLAVSWFLTCEGSDDAPDYVPGEVFVRFVAGTTQSQVEALASDLGLEVNDIIFDIDPPSDVFAAVFIVPEGEELDWIPVVEESPIVSYACLSYIGHGGPPPGCSAGM